VWFRVFQPSPKEPLDFEGTIEQTLLELRQRFYVREVRYDPYQLVAVAQRLTAAGLPMVEFPQSVQNLTESSTNLYEALKGRNMVVYPDDELRLAVSRCVAVETTRGWRIAKEKASHKIDVVVALAMAALGAVHQGQAKGEYAFLPVPGTRSRFAAPTGSVAGRGDGLGTQQRIDAEDDAAEAPQPSMVTIPPGPMGPISKFLISRLPNGSSFARAAIRRHLENKVNPPS